MYIQQIVHEIIFSLGKLLGLANDLWWYINTDWSKLLLTLTALPQAQPNHLKPLVITPLAPRAKHQIQRSGSWFSSNWSCYCMHTSVSARRGRRLQEGSIDHAPFPTAALWRVSWTTWQSVRLGENASVSTGRVDVSNQHHVFSDN